MQISNLKIGTRLTIGFGALVVMLICIAAFGLSRLLAINAQLDVVQLFGQQDALMAILAFNEAFHRHLEQNDLFV